NSIPAALEDAQANVRGYRFLGNHHAVFRNDRLFGVKGRLDRPEHGKTNQCPRPELAEAQHMLSQSNSDRESEGAKDLRTKLAYAAAESVRKRSVSRLLYRAAVFFLMMPCFAALSTMEKVFGTSWVAPFASLLSRKRRI